MMVDGSSCSPRYLLEPAMITLADRLPAEIRNRLHPDWVRNEVGYWAARPQVIEAHNGRWVAFADGVVIAAGDRIVEVAHKAKQLGKHAYVTRVGFENTPQRIRRMAFAYDTNYQGEALPVISVRFAENRDEAGEHFDRVIPDTGADSSVLPWEDCQMLSLQPQDGLPSLMAGVGQSAVATLAFPLWVFVGTVAHPALVQADFDGRERILGRDVLNRLSVCFDGPGREVMIAATPNGDPEVAK
jgi:predicted aspartyl protease